MEGKHELTLPRFVCLSDAAFTLLLQLGIAYNLLAHYYSLDYNTNGKPFGKRYGMGLAAWETNTYANLTVGKVYKWKGFYLTGDEEIDINVVGSVTLTRPEEDDTVSAPGLLNAQPAPTVFQLTNKLTLPAIPHKTSKLYQTSQNQVKTLLNSLKTKIMPSLPHVPSTVTNVTKDLTVDSLVKVSDDEEMLAPPEALSATLAKMQAKEEALQYHANVKITVLSVVAERLDSTVLR